MDDQIRPPPQLDGDVHDQERSSAYTVVYRGATQDDAEYQFELDERRHVLQGYVPTNQRWLKKGWTRKSAGGTLSGLLLWGGPRQIRSAFLGSPADLEVTYSLEHELHDDE